jgi:hypothetical protein
MHCHLSMKQESVMEEKLFSSYLNLLYVQKLALERGGVGAYVVGRTE